MTYLKEKSSNLNSRVTFISGLLKRQITPHAALQFHKSRLFVSFHFSAADDAFFLKLLIDRSSKGYVWILKPYAWGSAKEPLTTSWYDASNTTVKPVFSGTVLSGHSLWSGWLSLRSRNLSDFRINFVLNSHLLIDVKGTSRNFERRWQSLTLLYICFSVELFTIVSQFRILKNGSTFHRIFECISFFNNSDIKFIFILRTQ